MPLSPIPASYPTPTLHQDSLKFCSYKLFLLKCFSSFEKVLSKALANKLGAPYGQELFFCCFSILSLQFPQDQLTNLYPNNWDWLKMWTSSIILWSSPPSWISCWPDAGHTQPAPNPFHQRREIPGCVSSTERWSVFCTSSCISFFCLSLFSLRTSLKLLMHLLR